MSASAGLHDRRGCAVASREPSGATRRTVSDHESAERGYGVQALSTSSPCPFLRTPGRSAPLTERREAASTEAVTPASTRGLLLLAWSSSRRPSCASTAGPASVAARASSRRRGQSRNARISGKTGRRISAAIRRSTLGCACHADWDSGRVGDAPGRTEAGAQPHSVEQKQRPPDREPAKVLPVRGAGSEDGPAGTYRPGAAGLT